MSREPAETASHSTDAASKYHHASHVPSGWRPLGLEPWPDHLLSVVTLVTHQLHLAEDLGARRSI